MAGQPPGPLVRGVMRVMESEGEATLAEMAVALNTTVQSLSAVVYRMRRKTKTLPKRLYVIRWCWEDESGRRPYLRAVLAMGRKADAPRPAPKPNPQTKREWRARAKTKVNSVFAFAAQQRERHAAVRAVDRVVRRKEPRRADL